MKHTMRVTLILVLVYLVSQFVGLAVVSKYVDHKEFDPLTGKTTVVYDQLPLNIQRPEVSERFSFLYIFSAVIVGTLLALVLIKYRTVRLWKVWFFLSIVLCLTIAFKPYLADLAQWIGPTIVYQHIYGLRYFEIVALGLAGTLAFMKIFRPGIILSNLTEIFMYGGLSAIFVPMINIPSAILLLIVISLYDMYAVWRSKHMIALATFQQESKVFAGLAIPYAKEEHEKKHNHKHLEEAPFVTAEPEAVRMAILGGGDIGFPMFFAGVVMKTFSFTQTLLVPICTTIALYLLLTFGKSNRYYPAMPYLSFGCFVGYALVLLLF